MWCQRRIGGLTLAHDDRVEILAQLIEFTGAARRETVASLEAETETEVHQLQYGQEGARGLPKLAEQIEEPLAAADFLVEAGYQRACCPSAGAAPWRVQHHIVQAGAQRVMRWAKLVHRYAGVARRLLERADLLDGAFAEFAGVGLAVRVAQAAEQLQQRCRGLDQRVEAEVDLFGAAGGRRGGLGCRGERRRRGLKCGLRWCLRRSCGAASPGHGADHGSVGIVGFGEWIVAHVGYASPPLAKGAGGRGGYTHCCGW